jgi:hypothetical protein
MQPRHFVPAGAIVAGLGTLVVATVDRRALTLIRLAAGAYAGGIAAAAVGNAPRLGWAGLPGLLAVFPILHLSYGSGFLWGMIRFFPRWWSPEESPPQLRPVVG